jgi:thymidine kinase
MQSAISCSKLEELVDKVNLDDYDAVGIDEGQFFQDIVDFW